MGKLWQREIVIAVLGAAIIYLASLIPSKAIAITVTCVVAVVCVGLLAWNVALQERIGIGENERSEREARD